jgi:hypothetical protein
MTFLEEESIQDLDPDAVSILDTTTDGLELPGHRGYEAGSRVATVAGSRAPAYRGHADESLVVEAGDRSADFRAPPSADGEGASVEFSLSELELVIEDLPIPNTLTEAAKRPSSREPSPSKARRIQRPKSGRSGTNKPPWAED